MREASDSGTSNKYRLSRFSFLTATLRVKAENEIKLNTTSLTTIFDSHKEQLAEKLQSFSLPRDSKDVQKTVADFLSDLFESDGAYRQSLTQSEDYILQSAILLLKAQQDIATEIASMANTYNASPKVVSSQSANPYTFIVGTGIGAAAGSLLGTWGAVCGAIAGTAIAIYLATKYKASSASTPVKAPIKTINVNAFVNIVKKICESIDNLMETYRVQVKRIQQTYEQKEVPTLQTTYAELLDKIANTINVVQNESATPKINTAIDMLTSSLENYDLKYENGRIVSDK